MTRTMFVADPDWLDSIEDARREATFPVQLPQTLPPSFELKAILYYFPDFRGDGRARRERVHADWLELTYRDGYSGWIEVTQGYFPKFRLWTDVAPTENRGEVLIGDRAANWVSGSPVDLRADGNGKPIAGGWQPSGLTAVWWLDATDGDSSRYFTIASNVMSIADLVRSGESVPF